MNTTIEKLKRMREASGNVTSKSKLVAFLYFVLRDEISPSRLETIVDGLSNVGPFVFTNGWIALHAKDVANRIAPAPKVEESETFKNIRTLLHDVWGKNHDGFYDKAGWAKLQLAIDRLDASIPMRPAEREAALLLSCSCDRKADINLVDNPELHHANCFTVLIPQVAALISRRDREADELRAIAEHKTWLAEERLGDIRRRDAELKQCKEYIAAAENFINEMRDVVSADTARALNAAREKLGKEP